MALLDLRPNCECCDRDLPPNSTEATICTFECTFCSVCAQEMAWTCKNCGGNLAPRPIRPARVLANYPASTTRVLNPTGCPAA
ncbi:MAG: DUF1272 domain-containing protein [Acidimicrobiia bacterium]|nr:DUF1272 domain-containing protein [Acidimicrobiia bacterium]MYG71640.1 DUF1272 domain-containing protein [Acidimicrobiia bacterium]